jgi:hypothetical protein
MQGEKDDCETMIISITSSGAVMRDVNDGRVALSGVGTLAGTPGEIGEQLRQSGAERAIALTFAHESERTVRAIADALGNLAPMLAGLIKRRQHEALDKIVDALVPSVPLPEHMMAEARMTAHARSVVLASGDWLTAAQVAELAGFSTSNLSAQPNKWKKEGQIFAIRHQGLDYFPAYGLDAEAGYRPLKAMAPILAAFGMAKDGWGLAYWFASVNSFLGGKLPKDVLAKAPERVLAAATDEVAEIAHG